MSTGLQFSKAFWVALSIVYFYCLFLLYAFFLILSGDLLDTYTDMQMAPAKKLTSARLVVMVFGLIGYPIILSRFLKYAKYVTVALTAWATIMYIEDYFVLYNIVEYPEAKLITLVQSLRPIFILSLIWMCFELTFRPQPRD